MALNINGTKFLLLARSRGVDFSRTAMIGRQELFATADQLAANLLLFNYPNALETAAKIVADSGGYAESFLRFLGAAEITSFDASDYEDASIVHDFNTPISSEFKSKYTCVLDGGTLEHVFNFPVAIKNCMEMAKVGGHYLSITPTNNQCGHGFYQFSPELLYRVFSEANGFEVEKMMIFEETRNCVWHEVADPDVVKERVTLMNSYSTMILLVSKKVRETQIFATTPQQSDYVSAWQNGQTDQSPVNTEASQSYSPLNLLRKVRRRLEGSRSMLLSRPNHFKKVDLP